MVKGNRFDHKILFLIILVFVTAICLSGCWDRRELDTLAIVTGMALDKASDDKIQVNSQVIIPGNIKSPQDGGGGGGGAQQKAYQNLVNTDETIFRALRRVHYFSERRLYFSHIKLFIFGEDLAKGGLQKYVDFFARDPEPRITGKVLIAKGKASEILSDEAEFAKVPSLGINQILERSAAGSEVPVVTLKDFLERLISKTTAPIAPLIELESKKRVKLAGTAVFNKDKMVGSLNYQETRGLLWVINKVKGGILEVTYQSKANKASIEIIEASSQIKPEFLDNQLFITINTNVTGNLGEQMFIADLPKDKSWPVLEQKMAAEIQEEITASLDKARDLNTDVFGFGEAVHKKYPAIWKSLEKDWHEIWPSLDIRISVQANLQENGMIVKSPQS
ncbi:Ger(x)C family spore germination protein [Desulfotomaculum defluvii]